MAKEWTVITAERVLDGTGGPPIAPGVVVIQGDEITAVGRQGDVELPTGPEVTSLNFTGGQTVLPGLVDVHTHLIMPGDGTPYQTFMQHNDGVLLMQAAANARTHLLSGVTTIADTGARGSITFSLKEAIKLGLLEGPRLVVCGRPITRTGGHCWFLGAEADGPDECSAAARQLLKEGADIIKVMATGGGTAGTYPYRPSLTRAELTACVEEAHALGKHAIAHASATAGTVNALDAGFDVIFHCHFYEADGTLNYADEVARRIADSGVFINPTLWVNGVYLQALRDKAERETLTPEDQAMLEARTKRYAGQVENVGKLVQRGVQLVAGSDAGWGAYPFGDLFIEVEEMVRVGLPAGEAVVAATSRAAKALGVADQVGSLQPGKKADILVVDGNPDEEITALRNVQMVMAGGSIVRQAASAD